MRTILLTLALTFCGLAQAATSANLQTVGQISTDDSRVEFSDRIPSALELNGTPIYITVFFAGKNNYQLVSPVHPDRTFAQEIPLQYGPGIYQVEIAYSKPWPSEPLTYSKLVLNSLTINNEDRSDESYRLPSAKVESDHPIIQNLAAQIILAARATTELEKAKAIHDWVSENITYDYAEYSRILHPNTGAVYTPETGYIDGSATYTLKRKTGVCEDYAVLYAALARVSGLQAQVIHGRVSSGDHAWNKVFANGQWIILDSTFDAGQPASQRYFNPTPELFAVDHIQVEIANE
jgi:transglutaminase-like putative cysteine protease